MKDKTEMTAPKTAKIRTTARRVLKVLGVLVGGIFLAALVAAALFTRPAIRERLLSSALSRASDALPGSISVGNAAWPRFGFIELTDVTWVDESDSLFAADRLVIDVTLRPLLSRDVEVKEISIDGVSADIPAISSRFHASGADSPVETTDKGRAFPRDGSFPGIPSIAIHTLSISARSIRLSEGETITALDVLANIDLRRDRSPVVRVSKLTAQGPDDQWSVERLSVDVDLDKGRVDGTGRGLLAPKWPVFLSMSSTPQDSFFVVVSDSEGGTPPDNIGIAVRGKLSRDGTTVNSIIYEALIRTPGIADLSRIPRLTSSLEKIADLEGITLELNGAVQLKPELTLDAVCDIQPNAWLANGGARVRYANDILAVDGVAFDVTDLSVTADARISPSSLSVTCDIEMRGSGWTGLVRGDLDIPPDLKVWISGKASKRAGQPFISMTVDAAAKTDDKSLDHLWVHGDVSLNDAAPSRIRLEARAMGAKLAIASMIDLGDDITVRLAPVRLEKDPAAIEPLAAPDSIPASSVGVVRYSRENSNLAFENIRITGGAGEIVVDGRLDGRKEGVCSLEWSWPEPPAILLGFFEWPRDRLDTLATTWRQDAPFSFNAVGSFALHDAGLRARASGSFVLPGPRTLVMWLPDSARVDDMGPLYGEFTVDMDRRDDVQSLDAALDLSETSWIDSSLVHVQGRADRLTIDLGVNLTDGVSIRLSGVLESDQCDFRGGIEIADSRIITRFIPDSLEASLRVNAHITGTPEQPNANGFFTGAFGGEGYNVPRLEGEFDVTDNEVSLHLDVPKGLTASRARLDSLSVRVRTSDRSRLTPLDIVIDGSSGRARLYQTARLDSVGGWSVVVDTFDFALRDRDMRSRHSFRVAMQRDGQGIEVDDLDLVGSLGVLKASGIAAYDSSNFDVELALSFPDESPWQELPNGLWPSTLDVNLRARRDSIEADLRLVGLVVPGNHRPVFDVTIRSGGDGIAGEIAFADTLTRYLNGKVKLPATVRVYPPKFAFRDGPVSVDGQFDRFPLAIFLFEEGPGRQREEVARINGRIQIGGHARAMSGRANATMSFPEWPALSGYEVVLESTLGDTSSSSSTSHAGVDEIRLAAGLTVERDHVPLLEADLSCPMRLSLIRSHGDPPAAGDIHVTVDAREFPLKELDTVLPFEIGLRGSSTIHLTAEGPMANLVLDGSVSTKDFEISVTNRARVAIESDLRIGGTRSRPSVEGRIELTTGLIRIPELPKGLHPKEGPAALLAASEDSAAGPAPPTDKPPAPSSGPKSADVDIIIDIPNGFWLRGQGLDVELAGDLHVEQEGTHPRLTGTLRAVRGTLLFLGRSFRLDQGTVVFHGGDEINPSMAVQLSTTVSNTKVKVIFSGTPEKPRLDLSSEPHLEDGDIISLLLFGKPFNDLNDDQSDMMQRRTAEIFASLGAAQLQEIGGQLGIDVVTFRSSEENEKGEFAFGKYLSPQVLLSYVQPLDDATSPFISLDYFLRGQFRIQTMYGQRNQTSIGIGWAKDY